MAAVPQNSAPAPPPAPCNGPRFVQSKRGHDKLFHEGFLYQLRYTKKGGAKQWICDRNSSERCPGTWKSWCEGLTIVAESGVGHNHLPQPERAQAADLRAQVRSGSLSQPASSPVSLVAGGLQGIPAADLALMPSNRVLKRTAWRARLAQQRKQARVEGEPSLNLETLAELEMPTTLTLLDGSDFLLYDSGPADSDSRFLIFGTSITLDALVAADVWLADGTFKTAPQLFTQVYTVHAARSGFTLPCLYGLLPDKSKRVYTRFWKAIRELLDTDITPSILLDFEKAAYTAVQEAFGEVNLGGCFFHFKQALHRQVQTLGMATRYANSFDFRFRVAKLGALAFLPPQDVFSAFETLAADIPDEELELLHYFERTWVGERHKRGTARKAPQFPLDLWSVHTRALDKSWLTNNNAELFHRHNSVRATAGLRPTLPTFLTALQAQHRLTHNDLTEVALGTVKQERPTTRARTERLSNLVVQYLADHDDSKLLSAVAYTYLSDP